MSNNPLLCCTWYIFGIALLIPYPLLDWEGELLADVYHGLHLCSVPTCLVCALNAPPSLPSL